MSDIREALVALLNHPDHAPLSAHDPRDGSCQSCPWPLHEMPPEDIADAFLAEFDVTPRGSSEQPGVHLCANPDAPDHPPHGIPLYIESWGTCDARPAPVVLNSPHGLGCLPGCGHDRSEAAVPDSEHDHEWQRRQNVTSRGYRLPPYEVCMVAGCDAARQVDEPAALMPAPPTVKPTLEQVVDALAAQPPGNGEWTSSGIMQAARAVLALLPGRTETEVRAEAWDEGAQTARNEDFLADDFVETPNPYRGEDA